MLLDDFMGEKPVIVYDTHEARTFVVRYLKEFKDIAVIERSLEIADYLVQTNEGTIAVERKRASDFLTSISDGRLFTQLEHLAEYEDARIILEGAIFTSSKSGRCYSIDTLGKVINPRRSARTQPRTMWSTQFFVHPHALTSIFKKIQDRGVAIIPTGSAYDTADILRFWTAKEKTKEYLTIRHKKEKTSDLDKQLFLLAGLIGVGTKRAEELLKKFGTPMRIFNAFLEYSPKKFPIDGIGEKTVAEIKKMLTTNLLDVQPSRLIEHEFREDLEDLEEILHKTENELKGKTIPELKEIARQKNLRLAGTKGELVKRILATMGDAEKIDIPLFLKKYEQLLRIKTEFQNVPQHLQNVHEWFRKLV